MRTPHAGPNPPHWLSSGVWQRMRCNENVGNSCRNGNSLNGQTFFKSGCIKQNRG